MSIVQMSIQGAVLIAAIVIIRALGMGKLPKWSFQALWGVALARLLLPFTVHSRLSIYTFTNQLGEALAQNQPIPIIDSPAAVSEIVQQAPVIATNALGQAAPAATVSPWMAAWAFGMVALALYFAITHVRSRRIYGAALPVGSEFTMHLKRQPLLRKVSIRTSDQIPAPLTYGVLRPVILLPKALLTAGDEALVCVLAHEMAHIRHWDAVKKGLIALALCVHWFNPLVWAMFVLFSRDIEICCDERVVRSYGDGMKAPYATMLIDFEEKKSGLSPLYSHFSKSAIEERITSIMKMKRISMFSVVLAIVLVVGAATAFATSAAPVAGQVIMEAPSVIEATSTTFASNWDPSPEEFADSYAKYIPYGMTYDKATGRLYYRGKLVRYFEDMYPVGENGYAGACSTHPDGEVDVHGVRDLSGPIVRNADGSFDPSGVLTGLEAYSQEEFDARTKRIAQVPQAVAEGMASSYQINEDRLGAVEDYAGAVDSVEWYTYDEFKAHVERERQSIQEVIGGRGWNPTEGWYTWTQERADKYIASLESTLEEIRNGMKLSKSVNGANDVMLASNPSATSVMQDEGYAIDVLPGTAMAETVHEVTVITPPADTSAGIHSYSVAMDSGVTVTFGPYDTQAEVNEAAKRYFNAQVAGGQMTRAEADSLLAKMPQQ